MNPRKPLVVEQFRPPVGEIAATALSGRATLLHCG
jgi:hypothetical protein